MAFFLSDRSRRGGHGYGCDKPGDFEYERSIAHMNKSLYQEIETILMFTDPQFAFIHSTIVREIIRNKGDVSSFLPKGLDVYSLGA